MRVTTNYIHLVIWLKLYECLRMIPCEHILSHKRRHRAHRDGHVLFCIFTYSHFRPINTWSHEIHWICHRTKHFCGGRPHRLMQQQQKQRSGNVPRSNMAAPLTCFSLLMNVIHSVFENDIIKTICYDTLVCVWGLSLQLWWSRFLQANQQLKLAVTLLKVRNYICIWKGLMASL